MSGNVAQSELQSFVRRIESVEDEIKALNEDKSGIYKEARNDGFDVKILRKVIAARRMDAEERREQGELFELYWDAVHGVEYRVVRAHVENIEEFHEPQPETAVQTGTDNVPATPSPAESEAVAISAPVHEAAGRSVEASASAAPLAFTPKPLRPHCLKPHNCGGQGRQHCWSCTKAMNQAGAA